MTPLAYRNRSRQSGFTLVEALIALLVVSFGMLALAGMQITMTRSADLAKQRSEAVRLAQLKMEQLRSFDGINSGTYTYGANVVSSGASETICPTCTAPLNATTNATFSRSWTVTRADGVTAATSDDLQKWIRVDVSWTDRANQTQTVSLNSVIARNDPIAISGMVGGQARARTRSPKNRNINVPYPAVTLSGGKTSAFVPPPGNKAYVFDNNNANILKQCSATAFAISTLSRIGGTVTVTAPGHALPVGAQVIIAGTSDASLHGTFTVSSALAGVSFTYTMGSSAGSAATGGTATRVLVLTEGMDLSTYGGVTCTDVNAYLISGYVRFKTSGAAPTASNIENTDDQTLPLSASTPLTIDSSATGNGPTAQECYAQREKVVSANNVQPSTLTSASRSGGVVTVTTSGNHGYAVGQYVAIEETGNFQFNGSFLVASVPSSTSFTYAQPGTDGSTSGGTATLIQQIKVPETASTPGYNSILSRFISYSCIVTAANDGTAVAWWGELKLVTDGTWSIGSTNSTYKVCRFSGDYYDDGVVSNSEHPRYYRRVKSTVDNQNFLVIKGSDDCPTDVSSNPVAGDYINTGTVQHQPALSGDNSLSFECTNSSCSGGNKVTIEPTTATTAVQMVCPATVDGCT
jgi:type IV pilus modification protein PilV